MKLVILHQQVEKKFPKLVAKLSKIFIQERDRRKCNRLILDKHPKFAELLEQKTGLKLVKIDVAMFHTILTGETSQRCVHKGCQEETGYDVGKRKYKEFCSKSCANASGVIRKRREKTMLEKYGVVNAWQSDKIKEKIAKTNIAKYGVANPSGTDEVIKARQETSLKRYGSTHHMKTKAGKKAVAQAMVEKYGVTNCMQLESTKNKQKATLIERYGVSNPMQNKEIAKLCHKNGEAACLKKYGVRNAMLNEDVLARWQKSAKAKTTANFCGRTIKLQGYEKFALDKLNNMKPFSDITTHAKLVRTVPYTYKGKEHRYLPDAKIKMKDGSIRVVEIKSWFTLRFDKNVAKFKAATKFYNKLGADFILVIAEPENDYIRVVINPSASIKSLVKTAKLFSSSNRGW